jgi:hypothetical protein
MIDPDRLYELRELKPHIGSRATIYREARKGRLKLVKVGRSTRARGLHILEYLNNLPTLGSAA